MNRSCALRLWLATMVAAAAVSTVGQSQHALAQSPNSQPRAPAEPKTSSLSWTRLGGTESCIGPRQLARAVEQLLGRAVFVSPAKADVSVEGRVERRETGGWQAFIAMSDERGQPLGTREIQSDESDCRALDDPVALAIALMIDPDAVLRPEPSTPPKPPAPPEVVVKKQPVYVPVPVDRPVPTPAAAEQDGWHWAVRAGPVFGVGVLPGFSPGLAAGVTAEPPWFIAVEGSATMFFEQKQGQAQARGQGHGAFEALYFGGALCPVTVRGSDLVFSMCGEAQLGALWGEGQDLTLEPDGAQFVCNIALRLRLSYRIVGPLTVAAGFAGAVPLIRDRFVVRDEAGETHELFRMSPVLALPDVSVGLRFP